MTSHPGERLSAFLDGELPVSERAEVEGHLRECAACARELEELAAVDALARELPVMAPPGYFEALPARVRTRVRRRPRAAPLALWAAAAAAVLVAVVAPLTLQRARPHVEPAAQARPDQGTLAPPATTAPAYATPAPLAEAPRRARAAEEAFARHELQPTIPSGAAAQSRLAQRDRAEKATVVPAGPPPAAAAPEMKRKELADAPATAPPAPSPAATALAARPDADGFEAAAAAGKTEVAGGTGGARKGDDATASPRTADAVTRNSAPSRQRKLTVAGGVLAETDRAIAAEQRYQALIDRRPATLADARALRDAWETFARDQLGDPRADEARVRAIEAGAAAWRLGADPADLAHVRELGRAYLDTEGAPQRERVRAILDTLPRAPEP
jgi:hypothetical protein